jgi:hypothetical protein
VNKIPREPVQILYEEDVCDTSGCAVVALRSFSGERRADFRGTVELDSKARQKCLLHRGKRGKDSRKND